MVTVVKEQPVQRRISLTADIGEFQAFIDAVHAKKKSKKQAQVVKDFAAAIHSALYDAEYPKVSCTPEARPGSQLQG